MLSLMTRLLEELVRECQKFAPAFASIMQEARTLDMFYMPTRYPNGLGANLLLRSSMKRRMQNGVRAPQS